MRLLKRQTKFRLHRFIFVRRLHASSGSDWTMFHGAIVQSQDQGLGERREGPDWERLIHQTRLHHKIMFQFHAHFKHIVHFPKRSSRLLSQILSFVSEASLVIDFEQSVWRDYDSILPIYFHLTSCSLLMLHADAGTGCEVS